MNLNWTIVGIELLVSIAIFSFFVIFGTIKWKEREVFNYPPDIQKVYFEKHPNVNAKQVNGKNKIFAKLLGMIFFLVVLVLLCWLANAKNFLDGFVFSLIFFCGIAAWDTFFIDWVLFANIKAFRLPGTEKMDKAYHQKWFHLKSVLFPALPLFLFFSAIIGLIVWALPL